MIRIVFKNIGGELDSDTAESPEEAAQKAIAMIKAAGELHEGDVIEVVDA